MTPYITRSACTLRPASPEDEVPLTALTERRFAWMAERGYEPWPMTPAEVASRASMPECPMWVLEMGGRIAGATILLDQPGTAVFTPEEREETCYVLTSTITDPNHAGRHLGDIIATWALEKAAADGRTWVRRVTSEEGLERYYKAQGFETLRSRPFKGATLRAMQRRA
ncbi:GNAT family N-acetyltransferase [Streptomyces sp. NPDC056401]|uniref:GNAT family N-acetyltransferase n=1 Tax=Streptomyces sp. NPDC056401 TaxID=3345809 RepID=UPI0035D8330E